MGGGKWVVGRLGGKGTGWDGVGRLDWAESEWTEGKRKEGRERESSMEFSQFTCASVRVSSLAFSLLMKKGLGVLG